MNYLIALLLSASLAAALTPLVRRYAVKKGIMAQPRELKAHALDDRRIPYLGGLAVWASFTISALVFVPVSRQLVALLIGGTIVAILGAIDDAKGLSPWSRLGWQTAAALVVLAGGIGIVSVTNPFGGVIDLTYGRFAVDVFGLHFHVIPIANALTVLWLVGMINTINFLDGLDGLATGVSSITGLVLFALAVSSGVDQPLVAFLAIILAGSTLGFLPFNFWPARIFLGDSGAYFLGLVMALLAIYSGGKLATIGLVLGFTLIDALWAVIRRLRRGVHPFSSDREHLHHLLLDAGLSQRSAVILLYALAGAFGAAALLATGIGKLVVLIILVAVVATLIASLIRIGRGKTVL